MQIAKVNELKSEIRKIKIERKLKKLGNPKEFRSTKLLDQKEIKSAAEELSTKLSQRIEEIETQLKK